MAEDVREIARKAAAATLDSMLPDEAAQYISSIFAEALSDAAIDAYESKIREMGLVLVPREPTDAMIRALNSYASCAGYIEEGYAAMIAASPAHGESKQQQSGDS